MTGPTPLRHDQIERQARLTAAFADAGIGSSATLYALVANIYRTAPDWLARAQRVAMIARRTGEELGLDERTLGHVERAAWTQNLGTVVMGAGCGADDWDRADMWSLGERARIAADILAGAPFLLFAAELVRASREWFDGAGFPLRLRGRAIPLGARILHLAEMTDSLTSLCGALGVPQEAVNIEVARWAGTRLDPDVVAAWLRCSEEQPGQLFAGAVPQERHF
jgi:response regulator RpfG family c-di-GMP phosphodiesterase